MLAIRNQRSIVEAVVAVYQDITECNALERQKDEFIGIASYEFRTPLTNSKVCGEIRKEKFERMSLAKNAGLVQKLNIQVDRLSHLIHLLPTTKVAEGKLQL